MSSRPCADPNFRRPLLCHRARSPPRPSHAHPPRRHAPSSTPSTTSSARELFDEVLQRDMIQSPRTPSGYGKQSGGIYHTSSTSLRSPLAYGPRIMTLKL